MSPWAAAKSLRYNGDSEVDYLLLRLRMRCGTSQYLQ